ncbi:MAG TPA: M48 family metalloprotease [Acidimicrobiales bacterium]|jgi:Zn-dependent protease with chaperone function|nr:M48 family metalloprotease [Acidimicrobiales bacterium]
MGFTIRRSLPSITGLLALVLIIGVAAVVFAGAPVWFPAVFAIGIIGLQFAINPLIIQWLVPASVIDHDGQRYLTDHPVGELVARRCRDAGVPLVKLGIVDDGNPNAFTFGRTPRDARMWITRGLLERLDERELDAVVSHEVGHVKHWDFAVMTLAAVVPMVLYLVFLLSRTNRRAAYVAIGAYIAYWISYFTLLALSRAREYAADHWSAECTHDGDALASALVKIAYGMGQVHAEREAQAKALAHSGRRSSSLGASIRGRSMNVMGIFDQREAEALSAAFASGIDPTRAVAAMRWELVNPWGKTLEKLSSHPLVARRIAALEDVPDGAPKHWSVLKSTATVAPQERAALQSAYWSQLAIAVAPWVFFVLAILGVVFNSVFSVGLGIAIAGCLFLWKQRIRYPTTTFEPVDEVTSLLERVDASPVAGIGVNVKGKIIGRGMPGYVLSPDLVVQDASGFVPLLYSQPLPLWGSVFALFKADKYFGQEVMAQGWYRRLPGPAVELRSVIATDGTQTKTYTWVTRYVASGLVLLAGLIVMAVGLAGA